VSFFSLSVLSAAFRIWTSLQKLNSICFWSVISVGENEEKANTIQPPLLVFFLTFTFLSDAHARRLWFLKQFLFALLCTPKARRMTLGVHNTYLQWVFAYFFIFFSVFFLENYVGTWKRISPLCYVFRGLSNIHSLSFQFFIACFVSLIRMILQWITKNTPKTYLVSGKLELHDSIWKHYKIFLKP